MKQEVIILIAEDDDGHAELIRKNLTRARISNAVIRFTDGQEVVDYLFRLGDGPHRKTGDAFILLLDIRMPKLNGTEVLKKLKADPELRKIPVVMITTTDDPREIEYCYSMGCGGYITKPVEYETFVTAIRQLGFFLSIVQVPKINGIHE